MLLGTEARHAAHHAKTRSTRNDLLAMTRQNIAMPGPPAMSAQPRKPASAIYYIKCIKADILKHILLMRSPSEFETKVQPEDNQSIKLEIIGSLYGTIDVIIADLLASSVTEVLIDPLCES